MRGARIALVGRARLIASLSAKHELPIGLVDAWLYSFGVAPDVVLVAWILELRAFALDYANEVALDEAGADRRDPVREACEERWSPVAVLGDVVERCLSREPEDPAYAQRRACSTVEDLLQWRDEKREHLGRINLTAVLLDQAISSVAKRQA